MDKSINHLLCKLKVLSKIQSGQKIIIDDAKISILECDRNRWDRLLKWWFGENRYTMMDKLNSLYFELKDMINILSENTKKNRHTLERLSNEMTAAMRGLNNLMLTYSTDKTIISQMETISENFKVEIDRMNKYTNKPQIEQYNDNDDNNINNDKDNAEPENKQLFDNSFEQMISASNNSSGKYEYL
jgi:hypothetical protein